MKALQVERAELFSVLMGIQEPDLPKHESFSSSKSLKSPKKGAVTCVWIKCGESYKAKPDVVIVRDGEKKDFLAWCSTFIASFVPITAFVNVLEIQEFKLVISSKRKEVNYPHDLISSFLMIGEVYTLASVREEKIRPNPAACLSTFSCVSAQHLFQGGRSSDIDFLFERWQKARNITNQQELWLKPDFILHPIKAFSEMINSDQNDLFTKSREGVYEFSRLVADIHDKGKISPKTLVTIFPFSEGVFTALDEISGTREQRLKRYEEFVNVLIEKEGKVGVDKVFLCAYAAFLMAPFSLEYIELVSSLEPIFPAVSMWYALLSSGQSSIKVTSFQGGLPYRVARDVLDFPVSSLSSHSSDISFDELVLLHESSFPYNEIRTSIPGVLKVHLESGVSSVFKIATKKLSTDQPEDKFLYDEVLNDFLNVIDEIQRLEKQAFSAKRRLLRKLSVVGKNVK